MVEQIPKFEVGDTVRIVSAKDCEFGCCREMERMVGGLHEIVSRTYRESLKLYRYELSDDPQNYWWSANCLEFFVVTEDLGEIQSEAVGSFEELIFCV